MNSFSSKLKKLNLHPCFSRVDSRSVRHRHITPGTEGVTFNNVKCEWCHPPPVSFFRQMFCVEMIKVGGSDLVLIINNYYPDWNEMKDQLSSFPCRHHQPGSSIQHRTHHWQWSRTAWFLQFWHRCTKYSHYHYLIWWHFVTVPSSNNVSIDQF